LRMGRHASLAFGLIATCGALLAPRAPRAPRARRAAASVEDVDAVVVGCGPAGLAAAIELRARGYERVVALDRLASPDTFETERAYLYLVDARGQRWTDRHAGLTAAVAARGVSNGNYTVSRLYPDARGVETVAPLLARPAAAGAIWIPRASLLATLADCARDRGVSLRYGAALEGLEREGGAVVASAGGAAYRTRLLVGADGASSRVRSFLGRRAAAPRRFEPVELESPSGGLRYKMLEVDPAFAATDLRTGARVATASAQAYVVPSKATNKRDRVRLGLLPSRDPALPRTANVIRAAGHRVWDLETGDDVLAWLRLQFPQLDGAVSADAASRFARADAGAFPRPRYTPAVAARAGDCDCFLVGDSAHAFPPDLGQGCNAALEDVAALGDALAASRRPTWAYQRARAPAARAIAKLVQIGFPFQYDQSRVRSKLFLVGLALRVAANAVAARLLPPRAAAAVAPPPAAFAVLDGEPYVDILARLTRANRAVAAVAAAAACAVARAAMAGC